MFDIMNAEAFSTDYAEYEALKQELNAQDEREWGALLRELMEG